MTISEAMPRSPQSSPHLSDEQIQQYQQEGWCLLPKVIPDDLLAVLRGGAQAAIDAADRGMDAAGVDQLGLNQRGSRYFSINPSFTNSDLYAFIFSDLMAGIASTLLSGDARVFWEQYVIKGAESGNSFAWHQDSAYVPFPHQRYLTCWCALDDMTEANGTARILPFSRGANSFVEHKQDPVNNDLIGYDGDDPGIPVICPAGSIACFTSHTLHSSGFNTSSAMRRVYLIQYSQGVIQDPNDWKPHGRSEPLVVNGQQVLRPA